ncbi:MAG: immune inhibitor A, partial [Bifidobacteriaceae bacterium]|nr:immune inhibitor A [Bifidobacteriaceae bacterium]
MGKSKILTALAVTASFLMTGVVSSAVGAAPAPQVPPSDELGAVEPELISDDLIDAEEQKRRDAQLWAAEAVARGEAQVEQRADGSRVVRTPEDDWVEYGVNESAQLLTILVEFGTERPSGSTATAPVGPLHGEIPRPEATDNSTYWKANFDRQHYLDMFFNGLDDQGGESFHDAYAEISSGRFDLQGDVTDWVKVDRHEAYYDNNGSYRMNTLVQDWYAVWHAEQLAAGNTEQDMKDFLARFDVWDRNDADGDGNFNEPDGIIDHVQIVHAGEGEEAGAPGWTIWSHRSSLRSNNTLGDTGFRITDYTTEPENGGLGVFCHEFGHDLGLPDFYDTGGGENTTAFWTLMSSGSWLGHGTGTIGSTPNHMGPHEKMQLGWLDYQTVTAGDSELVELRAAPKGKDQALFVDLPNLESRATLGNIAAHTGTGYWYGGQQNSGDSSVVSPEFTVPSAATLNARVKYRIENNYDYGYVEITTDGGDHWTPINTSLSTTTNPYGYNKGFGITGGSATTDAQWAALTADLSAYEGEQAQIRFRYVTDTATLQVGLRIDTVSIGVPGFDTDFDDSSHGWTLSGMGSQWINSATPQYIRYTQHYYLAENRQYAGYDDVLRTGPYNWANELTDSKIVEQFPYENGLLVWYANSAQSNNNVSSHPGAGRAMPVDGNATALRWSDGSIIRNRTQPFDATFKAPGDSYAPLHLQREVADGDGGVKVITVDVPRRAAKSVFDDSDINEYYDTSNPQGSVRVAGVGVTLEVKSVDPVTQRMKVWVSVPGAEDTTLPVPVGGRPVVGSSGFETGNLGMVDDLALPVTQSLFAFLRG